MTRNRPLAPALLAILPLLLAGTAEAADSAWLDLCTAYGTPHGGVLLARVHRGAPLPLPTQGESTGRRVFQTLHALDAHAIPGAGVEVSVGGRTVSAHADGRGYVQVALPPGLPAPSARVVLRLADPRYQAAPLAADVPVFASGPGLGVISDVDDTLLDTGVIHKFAMIEHAATRSSWELSAFPGAAEVLSRLARDRPLLYVSGSPWGFRQRITDYFARTHFPSAPLILKRFSSEPWTDQMAYKWPHIISLVDSLPDRRWILLGDSSEQDPEVYSRLSQARPGQVAATYIHLVTAELPEAPRFRGMVVFRDFAEVAADVAGRRFE